MTSAWPDRLWIVRHGQSAGNVARDRAHAAGLGEIDLAIRDVDVSARKPSGAPSPASPAPASACRTTPQRAATSA